MHCFKEDFGMAKKLISIATLFVLMAVSVFSAFAVEDETKNALVYGDVNIMVLFRNRCYRN